MKPLNRRLLIEVLNQQEETNGAFFVPQDKKAPDEFTFGKVLACASDCSTDLTGKKVIFFTVGLETIKVASKEYNFIGENHLICWE